MANRIPWPIPLRYTAFIISLLGLAVTLPAWAMGAPFWPVPLFAALVALGTWDLRQRSRTLRRNYPILAHFRYCMEGIGPEIRQYFVQSDTEERPFSREQRSAVYQRAKNVLDKKPFGSILDMYAEGYEWINPSLAPSNPDRDAMTVKVGSERRHPYRVSLLNISAMSFGALSGNAIEALNLGARRGGFYHDTGEGGISRHHLQGGDLVWEIGSGYFGCRDHEGNFDAARFAENAARPEVRMIEVKLSQGAKPGHGGILPGAKVTAEIAAARGVPIGEDVVSPASHPAFSTPLEMMHFIARLRMLADDKPVGIKLAIGHPWEWFGMVKAMLESDILPDFIVVDGGEGGTGASPLEFINRLGMPLVEALSLVHSTLVGANLRHRIRLAGAGKLTSAFHIARTLALGADWCNAGRGFMFSLGCIQAMNCHSGRCPSGVATQDPRRSRHLDVADKSERVYHYHRNTLEALAEMLSAAGLERPADLGPSHIMRRVSRHQVCSYAELYPVLAPGELLRHLPDQPLYQRYWEESRANSFQPAQVVELLQRA
ncbi:FMN-binding glutamate synthase family protein [Halomonas sp.]|uniref:FMN-binding glutamate synthase family protein n=1 Tax=Halomonas sp. TaxID=1486246 RepID=UPI00298DE14E|nr:FMN-binding glutamate synthase family protein [Halomonas sp.]MDW7745428.1 FMN-binding glutamate synthase family protein [Halomonas sp.]